MVPTGSFYFAIILLLTFRFAQAQQSTTDVAGCNCGFYDQDTGLVFTDSSVAYFNETNDIPDDLVVESFAHKYDRGWNALYRKGAAVENIEITDDATARNLTGQLIYTFTL